jgi:hypothetical protein
MPKVGIKGQTYCNTGSHSTPQWARVKFLRDLTVAISSNEVAVKNKGSIWEKFLSGLNSCPLDVEGDWEPGDPVFDSMQQCYWTKEPLEFLILDGGIKKEGAQGLLAGLMVTKFERGEPLEDVMSLNVSLRLAADWEHEPEWVKVGADGKLETVSEFGEDPDNTPD